MRGGGASLFDGCRIEIPSSSSRTVDVGVEDDPAASQNDLPAASLDMNTPSQTKAVKGKNPCF